MMYPEILKEVETYVTDIFRNNRIETLVFHNLEHTRNVVFHSKEICKNLQLDEERSFIVMVAAWFHDIGYLIDADPSGHEMRSADIASSFLAEFLSTKILALIRDCILATKMPQMPKSILQDITCDADLYHFGTWDLFSLNELMHKETEIRLQKKITTEKWIQETIQLLQFHRFHTEYCMHLLNNQKTINIERLRDILKLRNR